jgi:hypothetical protein
MKTIFEKIPLKIAAGQTVSLPLPQPFSIGDSLFLLVHNSFEEKLNLTLSNANGSSISKAVTLHSFPTIIVFSEFANDVRNASNETEYFSVSFTCFEDFEGSLTFRVGNPEYVIRTYQNS